MKIAFITTHLTIYGGGSKFLVDYSNELSKRGHEITIVAQKINYKHYKFNKNIRIIELGWWLPSNVLYWLNFNKIKKRYLNVLLKLNVDFLISVHFPTNYFCSLVRKNRNLKYLHFCLEPFLYLYKKEYYKKAPILTRIIIWFFRYLFIRFDIEGSSKADEIICISKFIKKQVKAIYHRDGVLHYLGIMVNLSNNNHHINFKKKIGLPKDTPILFALGLTHYLKGSRELIYIYKRILKELPESILLIAGKITKQNKKIINYLKKKLEIPNNKIILFGFIEQEFLRDFYAQSTLTLYTALHEPLGLIPLESMLNGTPVIAFNSGGPRETIIQGKTGFLINSHDYEDFAQKTIHLVKNEDLRKKFSKRAINYIKENFNIEKSVINLESILLRILSR